MIRFAAPILASLAIAPAVWAEDRPFAADDAVRLFEAACFVMAPNFAAAPAVLTAGGLEKFGDGYYSDPSGTLRAALMADELDRTRHCGIALEGADAATFSAEMERLVTQRWSGEASALPESPNTLRGFVVENPGFDGSLTYLVQALGESFVLGVIAQAPMGFAR